MFGYAARALLSRTLQALLSKYLVDVDIESLSVPLTALLGSSNDDKSDGTNDDDDNDDYKNGQIAQTSSFTRLCAASSTVLRDKRTKPKNENVNDDDDDDDRGKSRRTAPKKSKAPSSNNSNHSTNKMNSSSGGWGVRLTNVQFREGVHLMKLPGKRKRRRSRATTVHEHIREEAQEQDDHDDDGAKEEEEEEEEELNLQIGPNGRIGTLHVRLIGKEVHATVEDADLILEVVGTSNRNREAPNGTSADEDDASVSSATRKAANGGKRSPPTSGSINTEPLMQEANDIGQRVLQKNAIARILASLPNLFLHNCRVTVIVKPHSNPSPDQADRSGGSTRKTSDDAGYSFVLEIGVLSVTGGEDYTSRTRHNPESAARRERNSEGPHHPLALIKSKSTGTTRNNQSRGGASKPLSNRTMSASMDHDAADQNTFHMKRIQTGRGVDDGITLKVVDPALEPFRDTVSMAGGDSLRTPLPPHLERPREQWARTVFDSESQGLLLRVSGLDIHARVLTTEGSYPDGRQVTKDGGGSDIKPMWGTEYDEYTVDSMLFGVDYLYIPPDPIPTDPSSDNMVLPYIQSEDVPSAFHRIASGARRRGCVKSHSPHVDCPHCWYSVSSGGKIRHPGERCQLATPNRGMDGCTPLPGLVLYVSVLDSVEVNVDRSTLVAMGVLLSLFSAPKDSSVSVEGSKKEQDVDVPNGNTWTSHKEGRQTPTAIGDKTLIDAYDESNCPLDSFPYIMTPEFVSVIGVHMTQVTFRVQTLRPAPQKEEGHCFGYFFVSANSVTVGVEQLSEPSLPFRDMKIDIGDFETDQVRGLCRERIISLGSRPPTLDFTGGGMADVPWPCAASEILQVAPPFETLRYMSRRESHGIQLRLLESPGSTPNTSCCCLDVSLGKVRLDATWKLFQGEISAVISEMSATLFPKETEEEGTTAKSDGHSSTRTTIWDYRLRMEGGLVSLSTIRFKFPRQEFVGRKSEKDGFCVQALLHEVNMHYADKGLPETTGFSSPKTRWIVQLGELPEGVRMRILLFLDDVGPLTQALTGKRVTRRKNSYMRSHAANRQIVEVAKQFLPFSEPHNSRRTTATSFAFGAFLGGNGAGRRARTMSTPGVSLENLGNGGGDNAKRRQLLTKLQALDDDALEKLLDQYTSGVRS